MQKLMIIFDFQQNKQKLKDIESQYKKEEIFKVSRYNKLESVQWKLPLETKLMSINLNGMSIDNKKEYTFYNTWVSNRMHFSRKWIIPDIVYYTNESKQDYLKYRQNLYKLKEI